MATNPKPKRPHALLRGLLSVWLLSWAAIIALFVAVQLSEQPLFAWQVAAVWLGVMLAGWLLAFRLLRRLQKAPPA